MVCGNTCFPNCHVKAKMHGNSGEPQSSRGKDNRAGSRFCACCANRRIFRTVRGVSDLASPVKLTITIFSHNTHGRGYTVVMTPR